MVTIAAARRDIAAQFLQAGLASAALDARFLVDGALASSGVDDPSQDLPPAVAARLDSFASRRLAGEPVWRILGEREFWGLPFKLSPETLEPRPDSETLVEAALAHLRERRDEPLAILDLGAGTGCLLVSLLTACRQAQGLGIDISAQACTVAQGNADRNDVGGRARFKQGDWLDGISQRFDLVVSNPPYIASADIAGLDIGVRDFDPRLALDGGADGLGAYRILAPGLAAVLADDALVIFEIGAGQEADVVAIMVAASFTHIATRRDLGGHPRALVFSAERRA